MEFLQLGMMQGRNFNPPSSMESRAFFQP